MKINKEQKKRIAEAVKKYQNDYWSTWTKTPQDKLMEILLAEISDIWEEILKDKKYVTIKIEKKKYVK